METREVPRAVTVDAPPFAGVMDETCPAVGRIEGREWPVWCSLAEGHAGRHWDGTERLWWEAAAAVEDDDGEAS